MQIRVFESVLSQYGRRAGLDAFDRLVAPFFNQVLAEGRKNDAKTVLGITRRMLPAEQGSQLALELDKLANKTK
ncbi:MAG: hypothetical protein J6386_07750 [Candidatus Synoicihabitans palmerolidicus]|nr:hypothetical protein [Candidatus Synoicihabitans palmerolidicus]